MADDLITGNEAFLDTGDIARQLGFLPPAGSKAETQMAKLANVRTKIHSWLHGAEPEPIADGVWIVRGGRPRAMNVYLIEDEGGVTMFDAGISDMTGALRSITARLGGLKRIVLGHADCDHRGAAPGLDAPVLLPSGRARGRGVARAAFRPYWDFSKLAAYARPIYPKLLSTWDGGAVAIEGTVQEGDEVAGFRVVDLPGHAPGLIGLFRESDRLALVSDCFYTVDPRDGHEERRPRAARGVQSRHRDRPARRSASWPRSIRVAAWARPRRTPSPVTSPAQLEAAGARAAPPDRHRGSPPPPA